MGDPKLYKLCTAIFLCNTPFGTTAGTEDVKQDFAKAKALLKEAGYKGEKVVMMDPRTCSCCTTPCRSPRNSAQGGLNVEVQAMDWGTMLTRRSAVKLPSAEGGWNMFITGPPAPTYIRRSPLRHQPRCDKGWFGWYCDPTFEGLKDQWARSTDATKQHALVVEMQKRAYDQGAYVPLGQFDLPTAYNKRLSGVIVSPVAIFWNIEKK